MVLRHRMKQSSKLICKRKLGNQAVKRCFVGSEAIDWLRKISPLVHGRFHAIAMLQALLEEGVITHVDGSECEFKDKDILYRFAVDEKEEGEKPGDEEYTEEDLDDALLMLSRSGPDAQLRLALRKSCSERNSDDLALIYEELVHIKALQHLSTMVKKELAAAIEFETHSEKGIVVFNEGEEGKSWYIILKGAVNVVVHGKGVVCQLNEGDEFGKLALVNNALRTATIETAQDICHFLKIGKLDFNRIFRDVETNTVRLKEHTQDVLVLEKMNIRSIFGQNGDSNPQKYSVMAGTPIKMVEYLLETRIDKTCSFDDHFLNDFLVTFPIFMSTEILCSELLSNYHRTNFLNCGQDMNRTSIHDHSEAIKKRVVQLTERWCCFAGNLFLEDKNICSFVKDLLRFLEKDKLNNEFNSLRAAILTLHERFPSVENTADGLPSSQKNRLHARRMGVVDITMKTEEYKPIRGSDQNIFRVFCADHTYTTLALPYKATAQTIVNTAEERVLLGNDCVLCEVKSSGERIPLKPNEICVTTGLSVNGRLFIAPREHLDSLTPTPDQEGPACSSLAFLETVGSKELAFFISQYDYELFNAVNVYEFIYHMYGKENYNQITANLDLLLQRFNEVQFWVETQVLLTQQLNKRVYLLKKFIKLAAHCKEYNNWYSFFAIVMGLNSVAVSRLTQTWEKLPGKFRKIFEEFESTLEPSRNHRVYRLLVGKLKPPILPFMPLLMKDMTFTNEGNKTQFDELVNFEKMRMISSTLRLIQYCRSEPFAADPPASSTKVIQEITIFVRNLQVIDNQRTLTQLSHRLEPRKT
ncbi:rap guanine nucleotide exchange factor 4-like [Porites lutea]|uniref:rap guanine nucleotide exchange factor 4-like n=1 Tax=Porites lutea TaxID=51062 RepID=UPI003CC52D33